MFEALYSEDAFHRYLHVEDIRYAVHGSNNTDSYTNNPPHFGVKYESLGKNKDLSYTKWEAAKA